MCVRHTLRDRQDRAPVVLEDADADTSLIANVAVVDLGQELDLRRLERVGSAKLYLEVKETTLVGGIGLISVRLIFLRIRITYRSHNSGVPLVHITTNGAGANVGRRVLLQLLKFLIVVR